MTTGIIYETTNLVNGKKYRGQHRCGKRCGGLVGKCRYLGSGRAIQRAINKHGEERFRRHTIITCPVEFLNFYEKWFADAEWCRRDDTYNLRTGGKRHYVYTPEARARMSESHKGHTPWNKGKKASARARANMSAAHKGVPLSAEHAANIARANTGMKRSPEGCANMRKAQQRRRAKERGEE